ncbi:MAG TPA: DUF1080 domain-containing protein [Planctomycetaceae bacterium]|nr:DUF1080 domain-containing protein [Planctomycetaceae bacterium]
MTHFRLTALVLLSVLALAAAAPASEQRPRRQVVATDPEQAGPDFAVQGEYEGRIGETSWGAQVVALGGGRYDLVLYEGGLPGAGWTKGDPRKKAAGGTEGGAATFTADGWQISIEDGAMSVVNASDADEKLGKLRKTERKSDTLGAKPPEGALVLFDGTSAEHFKGGRLVDDRHLAVGCETHEAFGDHRLHIEFRTPFMPNARGQDRGNSGVYIHNRYECQVLDSFGLEGKDNECGGIYSIAEPAVNMCLPPLSWQTYDIDFTAARYENGRKVRNARVTIKHNGVVIHDNLELSKGTPGKDPEGPEPAGLYLQDHGNPVVFRNIWVVKK